MCALFFLIFSVLFLPFPPQTSFGGRGLSLSPELSPSPPLSRSAVGASLDLTEQERLIRRRTQNRESAQRRRLRHREMRRELADQNDLLWGHVMTLNNIVHVAKEKLAYYDPMAAAEVAVPPLPFELRGNGGLFQ